MKQAESPNGSGKVLLVQMEEPEQLKPFCTLINANTHGGRQRRGFEAQQLSFLKTPTMKETAPASESPPPPDTHLPTGQNQELQAGRGPAEDGPPVGSFSCFICIMFDLLRLIQPTSSLKADGRKQWALHPGGDEKRRVLGL